MAAVLAGVAAGLSPPFATDALNLDGLATGVARLPARGDAGVTLVLLDAATERHPAFAARPRALWSAPLADVVMAALDADAAVVAVDLVLPRADTDDARWLRALRRGARQQRLVLATAPGALEPTAAQRLAAGDPALASVNLYPDGDGAVRTIAARDGPLPTLAAAAAARAGASPAAPVPVAAAGARIDAWSAAALVDCPTHPALRASLLHRVVLIGAALPHEDRHRSALRRAPSVARTLTISDCAGSAPVAFDDPVPGALLHALAARTWLRGGVRWPSRFATIALVASGALAGAALACRRRVAAFALLVAAWSGAALLAFDAGWVPPWLPVTAALFTAAGVAAVLRHADAAWRFAAALPRRFRGRPDASEVRPLTACFVDIESFTAASEALADPALLARQLGECLTRLAVIAEAHRGFVDKYLGDGLLVLFGVDDPSVGPRDAVAAVGAWFDACDGPAALHIAYHPVRLRAGIATGTAQLGALGGTARLHFTAIGDCVNVAARLEQLNRTFDTRVLADAETAFGAPDAPWVDRGEHPLKGRRGRVRVFALNVRKRSL